MEDEDDDEELVAAGAAAEADAAAEGSSETSTPSPSLSPSSSPSPSEEEVEDEEEEEAAGEEAVHRAGAGAADDAAGAAAAPPRQQAEHAPECGACKCAVDTEDYMQCNHCRTALSARRQCLKCVCVLPCVLPCGTAPRGCVLERARGVWAVDGVRARESGQCTRGSSAAPGSMNGARWNLPRERDTLQLHSVVPRGMPVLA